MCYVEPTNVKNSEVFPHKKKKKIIIIVSSYKNYILDAVIKKKTQSALNIFSN